MVSPGAITTSGAQSQNGSAALAAGTAAETDAVAKRAALATLSVERALSLPGFALHGKLMHRG